jgi:hypothetical protein
LACAFSISKARRARLDGDIELLKKILITAIRIHGGEYGEKGEVVE